MRTSRLLLLSSLVAAFQLACSDSSTTSPDGPIVDAGADRATDSPAADVALDSATDKPAVETGIDQSTIDQSIIDQATLDQASVDGRIDSAAVDQAALDQSPAIDSSGKLDTSGIDSGANPCAACTAEQVCVQLNDGTCNRTIGVQVQCRTVSQACRTKLASSGSKSCTAISECESELCMQPYRCVYNTPCGNENPNVAVYCYGP